MTPVPAGVVKNTRSVVGNHKFFYENPCQVITLFIMSDKKVYRYWIKGAFKLY
jgi:hypothetical protein